MVDIFSWVTSELAGTFFGGTNVGLYLGATIMIFGIILLFMLGINRFSVVILLIPLSMAFLTSSIAYAGIFFILNALFLSILLYGLVVQLLGQQ